MIKIYMLWFSFIFGLKFYFSLFLGMYDNEFIQQRKIKFEPQHEHDANVALLKTISAMFCLYSGSDNQTNRSKNQCQSGHKL